MEDREEADDLNDETFGTEAMSPINGHQDFELTGDGSLVEQDEEFPEEEHGSFSMDSIYESLVQDEGEGGAAAANAPRLPPWFYNVPGFSPQQIAELVTRGQVPPQLGALLAARQAEFLERVGQQPPQPTHILRAQQQGDQNSNNATNNAGRRTGTGRVSPRTAELFDKHHHTHLTYWTRSFAHMTSDEIDGLLSQQRNVLKYSTYAEDYQYQQTVSRKYPNSPPPRSIPPLMGIHRPICLEPLDHAVRPDGDMFIGVLGKIPFSSIKSPKPVVQLPGHQSGVLRATNSKAIQALESGRVDSYAVLSVIEDGLLVALHFADIASIVPQLPSAEQPYFLTKQQQLIAALVYVLNVLVSRPLLPLVLRFAKGRKLLARCLLLLPPDQRVALFLVLLSSSPQIDALPANDDQARALQSAMVQLSSSFVVLPPSLQALVTVSQGFSELSAFVTFSFSVFGASLLSGLLTSVRRSLPTTPPQLIPQWLHVLQGLFDALATSFSVVGSYDSAHPVWTLLLLLADLVAAPQMFVMRSILRPILDAKNDLANNAKALKLRLV